MISSIRIQDIADILIMTFLIYQLYSWFRGTKAIQVLLGLGIVTLIFFATRFLDLYMTSWVLQELGTVLIVLVIVIFQSEIRQALYRFSLMRNMLNRSEEREQGRFQDIAETVFKMASRKTGALIVFQVTDSLQDLMHNGVAINSDFSPQLLESVFYSGSPLHDGALLINRDRIEMAACHLPLSVTPGIPQHLGTRHRAAIGLSERSDAVIVVVSEERGEVSLVTGGVVSVMPSTTDLILALETVFKTETEKQSLTLRRRFFSNMLPKIFILAGVSIFWILITTRQGQIASVTSSIRLNSLPEGIVLMQMQPEEVTVQIKALSSLAPPPSKLDLSVELNASGIKEGASLLRISHADINTPAGVMVTAVSPATIRVTTEKKLRKVVPVRISLRGELPPGISVRDLFTNPAAIEVEGPASQVAALTFIATEELSSNQLARSKGELKLALMTSKHLSTKDVTHVVIKINTRSKLDR